MVSSSTTEASEPDRWSASQYNATASFVYSAAYTSKIRAWLAPKPGENILDFGCGTGEITIDISKEIEGALDSSSLVVGVDSSHDMVEKARSNGLNNCFVGDIQNLVLPDQEAAGTFDAIFSNAALHWCKQDPAGVLRSAHTCLKKGGRFVAEMGGYSNAVGVRSALHNVVGSMGYDAKKLDPWYFPSVEHYKALLLSNGFMVKNIELEPRLTPLNGSLSDWLRLFCRQSWLAEMDENEAESIITKVEKICEVDCKDEQGNWSVMYCRLRFFAVKIED